jgi:antibiotic biosynthesis monooxygenase (ABM) superfamily enzyme
MQDQVTTIVKNKPKVGKEKECLKWMIHTSSVAEQFNGFLNKEIFRSAEGENLFVTVFTFDSKENLESWENSAARNRLIEEGKEFVESFVVKVHFTGLELFLPNPSIGKSSPVRWKMFLVTVIILFVLFNSMVPIMSAGIDLWGIHPQLKTLFILTMVVGTMTFLIMPILTRKLHSWLTS